MKLKMIACSSLVKRWKIVKVSVVGNRNFTDLDIRARQ